MWTVIYLSYTVDVVPRYMKNEYTHITHIGKEFGKLSSKDDDFLRQSNVQEKRFNIIPFYCVMLGAVVVGLVAYVAGVHLRRTRSKHVRRNEVYDCVEYSKTNNPLKVDHEKKTDDNPHAAIHNGKCGGKWFNRRGLNVKSLLDKMIITSVIQTPKHEHART